LIIILKRRGGEVRGCGQEGIFRMTTQGLRMMEANNYIIIYKSMNFYEKFSNFEQIFRNPFSKEYL